MCMSRITKLNHKATEWSVAYKLLREVEASMLSVPIYTNRVALFRRGEVVRPKEDTPVLTDTGTYYPGGFHCFRRRKDVEAWMDQVCPLILHWRDSYKIYRVFVRDIAVTGRDLKERRVVVARQMYIPLKRGDKPERSKND